VTTPEPFYAVGRFYEEFDQVTDEEVVDLLRPQREQHVGQYPSRRARTCG
jgi:predicted phosphoribosyltransferase